MKFTLAAVAAFASTALAASLPEAFTLVAEGGKTVVTDGQNLFVGTDSTANEVLILRGNAQDTPLTFTSKNSTPTGFQNLWVVEDDTLPVGLTIPHSAAYPEGASETGFGVNDDGLFTHDGNAYFAVDGYASGDQPLKVYWYGRHSSEYKGMNLTVKECKGC
ncbi:hypothetical protein N7539_008937 [Penicillium diatomitis]|uniref:Uncharacterized protein n=1 Tax=Penicillium diatomitis TaxID=2819901 RepID=A0A9W9WKS5_9EURO|nr:uncharacterized protein N7539_008937 [Penicillium diatomitis]KAJ5469319.1 hypothetical protein N7539_008937 [Penicillium diatomitis]